MFKITFYHVEGTSRMDTLNRIEGCIARTDDEVALRGNTFEVKTEHPADFVQAYYDYGFECELKVRPV